MHNVTGPPFGHVAFYAICQCCVPTGCYCSLQCHCVTAPTGSTFSTLRKSVWIVAGRTLQRPITRSKTRGHLQPVDGVHDLEAVFTWSVNMIEEQNEIG
jgi:hypothetical protein